jgi:hypothetical protein
MNDHIPDATKMISDTPISDSTPHNVGDLGMLCRRLERKLAATRHYLSVVSDRVKRLEEAGYELRECANLIGTYHSNEMETIDRSDAAVEAWDKEAKP